MLLKKRGIAKELLELQALRGRMLFSPKMERQLSNAVSGQMGENHFDRLADNLLDCTVWLDDLVLVADGRLCQIDALCICGGTVYLFEVKNWAGHYDLRDGEFTDLAGCPLAQLKRSRKLLEALLRSFRITAKIEARLVFVGTEVSLYGLRREDHILLAHQLPGFFADMRGRANPWMRDADIQLGQRILACHVEHNPYRQVTDYRADSIAPGIMCPECRVKMMEYNLLRLVCRTCNFSEHKKDSLKRTIAELDTLFPPEKHRVQQIYLWCDRLLSKRMIHHYLKC